MKKHSYFIGSENLFICVYRGKGFEPIYYDAHQKCIYNAKTLEIVEYTEGDVIERKYKDKKEFETALEETKKWYKENL